MNIQEFYGFIGGTYEGAIRHMVSEALVRKFVLRFPQDKGMHALRASLDAGLYDEAFEFAHTLKGLCGTLGFRKLTTSITILTEALRPFNRPGYTPQEIEALMDEAEKDYSKVISAISHLD